MERMARRALLVGSLLGLGSLAANAGRAQSGVWLLTGPEAALPPSQSSKAGRAISRGPAIRQISPATAVAPNQPFTLQVEFVGRGGEKIDPKTAQVVVLRGGDINVTQRLQPYITARGIEVPNAMVPAGNHVFQVAIKDDRGRESIANIEIEAR
jgi:hypothetical protein